MNLNWIHNLIDELPEEIRKRKNLIDIAGYPSWENVNSNFLAFYFDKNEDHCFGSLFIDSLSQLLKLNSTTQIGQSDFEVAREVYTIKGNRIDILISNVAEEKETDDQGWAIIIENKINHHLNNELEDYWNSVSKTNKMGVVLSKSAEDFPEKLSQNLESKKIDFKHISHKELIEKVLENLSQSFLDSDDRHLLFLKEFISNTYDFYDSDTIMEKNDKILELFQKNGKEIIKLKEQDNELLRYLSEIVINEMNDNQFEPNSNSISRGKHFYPNNEIDLDEKIFRLYIDIDNLRYENTLYAYLELHGTDNTKFGSKLKAKLKKKGLFSKTARLGEGGSDRATWNHIIRFEIPIIEDKISFKDNLKKSLDEHLWSKEIFKKTQEVWNDLVSKEP